MVIGRRVTRRTGRSTASARRNLTSEVSPPDSSIAPSESFDSIHSPFYLTNSDNPGLSIISEVLDGVNYDNWCIAMTIALDAKNKSAFIDGSLARPNDSHHSFRIWSRCNSMVKSWILNSVSKQIYKSILRFNDTSEIWKDLATRFHITNLPRSYQLSQQIWSLQQGSMDLATYYTTLKTLWDELEGASCVDNCRNCGCCKAMQKQSEQSKIVKFLAGLNESYAIIRSQIIMKKNVPELSEIYNLLDQDFNQRSISSVNNASTFQVAAAVQTPTVAYAAQSTAQQKQQKLTCTHCGYTGHTTDTCYKIHGYPVDFKHKNKSKTEKNYNQAKPSGYNKSVVAQLALGNTEAHEQDISTMVNNLTKDQIQGVIAYFNSRLQPLNNSSVASSSGAIITALPGMAYSSSTLKFVAVLQATSSILCSTSWIVDSGATHHVTCDKTRFESLSATLNASVTLPTSLGVKIEGVGSVRLSNHLVLNNVLYIPEFRLSL